MKKISVFLLALFLHLIPAVALSDQLSNQTISDVYVDDQGNLAFGVRVFGNLRVPNWIASPTVAQLSNLCVWNIGANKINDLRFEYPGIGVTQQEKDSDKQTMLSLLLLARMHYEKVTITYAPLATTCAGSDPTRCACADVAGLAQATSVTSP